MIDFENAQVRKRIAIRKCIETRAEHDVLPHTACDRLGQRILGEAASHREECAKIRRDRRRLARRRALPQLPRNLGTNNPQRQRILENERAIAHLMCRPSLRNTIRRTAGLPFLHFPIVREDLAHAAVVPA
jgi:hypothetical protein